MTEYSFSADAVDLRAALRAVAAHAGPDPEVFRFHRIRVYLTVDEQATVVATDGFTAGLARVRMVERHSAELGCFDLHPGDVKKILALFRPAKDQQLTLRLDSTEKHLTVTDVSGMFPGESLRLTASNVDREFPDVSRVLLAATQPGEEILTERVVVNPEFLSRFAIAGKVYGDAVAIEPSHHHSALVVSVGDNFTGVLLPIREPDNGAVVGAERRAAWRMRLPEVAASHPVLTLPADVTADLADLLTRDQDDDLDDSDLDVGDFE